MLSFFLRRVQPHFNCVSDLVLHVSQLNRLVLGWCVEIDAVATVFTVDHAGCHRLLRVVRVRQVSHSCPLPRVFFCVCKENIVACDVETAVMSVCLLSIVRWQISSKNSRAIVRPVRQVKNLRAHRFHVVPWCLEEAKLGTILISPLSQILVDVDLSVLERHSVVLIISKPVFNSIGSYCGKLGPNVIRNLFDQHVAEFSSVSILYTYCVDVR